MKILTKLGFIATFALFLGIVCISAYTLSSYHLTSVGQSDEGNPEKLVYPYPTVSWTNGTPSSDAQIAVTLSHKGLFSYSYVTRIQKWVKNVKSYDFVFDKMDKGTYRANIIFNASNDNAAISGQYYLTSIE